MRQVGGFATGGAHLVPKARAGVAHSGQKAGYERVGDWHHVRRFFWYDGRMTEMTPFLRAERDLKLKRDVTLRQLPGEFQIERGNYREVFVTIAEAEAAGMALEPLPPPIARKRRVNMHPKAVMKRRKWQHWRKRINAGKLA